MAELASTDELIQIFVKKAMVSEPVVQTVFNAITAKNAPFKQQRSAVILFAMLGKADRSIVEKRLDGLVRCGLGPLGQKDPMVAQYTCQAIQSVAFVQSEAEIFRLPNDNVLFVRITDFVKSMCYGPEWLQTITEAVNAIYLLADRPDALCADLIKATGEEVIAAGSSQWSTTGMSKLLFLAGQIALQHNLHLDSIERHWKRANAASLGRPGDDGLEQTTASAEDDFADVIREVKESELLYGDRSLLRVFGPLAAYISLNNLSFPDDALQRVATLTLSKFMSVSARFCEEHLALFLTIMEKSPDAIIRSNLVIALGDLCHAFSRVLDPHVPRLFARLQDSSSLVRRNAMMVLTHLTLTGMIKVRGQIGLIAACIEDQDRPIRDLARLFFAELAGKDSANAVYNYLPDIIAHLSGSLNGEPDKLARILKFVFDLIKKDRQLEALVEKLCVRLRQLDDLEQQRATCHCLSVLPLTTDRAVLRLIDGFAYYRDKLADPVMWRCFEDILAKLKKPAYSNIKMEIDQWELGLMESSGAHDKPGVKPAMDSAVYSENDHLVANNHHTVKSARRRKN